MLFLDLSDGAVMQISANFRPGKVSPKAYLQCQDLVPLAGKLRHLIMGGHVPPPLAGKTCFLIFEPFFPRKDTSDVPMYCGENLCGLFMHVSKS